MLDSVMSMPGLHAHVLGTIWKSPGTKSKIFAKTQVQVRYLGGHLHLKNDLTFDLNASDLRAAPLLCANTLPRLSHIISCRSPSNLGPGLSEGWVEIIFQISEKMLTFQWNFEKWSMDHYQEPGINCFRLLIQWCKYVQSIATCTIHSILKDWSC